jgi:hypothetical protein
MHNLNIFGAKTNHGQTRIHKSHHGPNLGESITFPLIVYFVAGHGTNIQMTFCLKTPKWESQNSQSWDFRNFGGHITLSANLRLRWNLKQSCSPYQELSNSMWHTTCTQGNPSNFRLLVVRSQIANLILGFSFDHNLCFRCPNGSCEPISDI